MHEAQEKEVSGNDLLNKSHDDLNQLQYEHERVVTHCEELTSELVQYRAWYEQACKELARVKACKELARVKERVQLEL